MADQVLYRIVRTDPPTSADFLSNQARGLAPRRAELRDRALWSGLSVYDRQDAARAIALRFPKLGSYIATLQVSDDSTIRYRKTLGENHYTIWGEPAVLLASVVEVAPV